MQKIKGGKNSRFKQRNESERGVHTMETVAERKRKV
jgi:hypothetical protein